MAKIVFQAALPISVPDFIAHINNRPDPPSATVSVLGGTHGEERLSLQVLWNLRDAPIRLRVAHPEAVKQNIRFLGKTQLMGHYDSPAAHSPDPEANAAHNNIQWFREYQNATNHILYDVHNSPSAGHYGVIGVKALQATVVGAFLLGFRDILVFPEGTFYKAVHNAVALECPGHSLPAAQKAITRLSEGLRRLAAVPPESLQARYASIAPNIRFFRCYELATTAPDGTIPSFILELEKIPFTDERFVPLALSPELRNTLGIRGPAYSLCVDHHNLSRLRPDLGTSIHGTPRRECFGALAEKIRPPRIDGPWLQFDDLAN